MYETEIDRFLESIVINLESSVVIRNVMEMVKTANYMPVPTFFDKAVSAYQVSVDGHEKFESFENEAQFAKAVKMASDTGTILQTLTHFNVDNPVIVPLLEEQLHLLLGLVEKMPELLQISIKFTLMRYLKHTALFESH
jgi:hypothetical protein